MKSFFDKSKITFLLIFLKLFLFQNSHLYAQNLIPNNSSNLLELLETLNDENLRVDDSNNNDFYSQNINPKELRELEKQRQLYLDFERSRTPSKLEKLYIQRSNEKLELKGYRLFEFNSLTENVRISGPQENYLIGHGDEIILVLQGGTENTIKSKVNNDGLLIFSFTDPISAEGRTFSEVKREIEERVSQQLIETKVYVSLGKIREISVIITGEVNKPGQIKLNGISNIIDALQKAGGVKKTGTLRNVKIINNGKVETIDLYNYIFPLKEVKNTKHVIGNGSTIIVPPIGKTVAISGSVPLPGIYEFLNEDADFDDFVSLSGGKISLGSYRFTLKRILENGNDYSTGNVSIKSKVKNGDILFISTNSKISSGEIKIFGAINENYLFPLDKYATFYSVFGNGKIFSHNARQKYVVYKRVKNEENEQYSIVNINDVIEKKININFNSGDEVFVFNENDLNFLLNPEVLRAVKVKDNASQTFSCEFTKKLYNENLSINWDKSKFLYLSNLFEKNETEDLSNVAEGISKSNKISNSVETNGKFCPEIFYRDKNLFSYILNNTIYISGTNSRNGFYLKNKNESIEYFLKTIDIPFSDYILSPDNKILYINKPNVKLVGEVNFQSQIPIEQNQFIQDILNDSRILKDTAYPFFATITRSERSTGVNSTFPFNPKSVFEGIDNFLLQENDIIRIFSKDEIFETLLTLEKEKTSIKEETNTEKVDKNDNKSIDLEGNSIEELQKTLISKNISIENINPEILQKIRDNFSEEEISEINKIYSSFLNEEDASEVKSDISDIESNTISEEINDTIVVNHDKLLDNKGLKNEYSSLILESIITLSGSIVNPGSYPIGGPIEPSVLIGFASGFTQDANINEIEISNIVVRKSSDMNLVYPGGTIHVPSLNFEKSSIKIKGAISNPRQRNFKKGLFLKDIIKSSITLKPDAYLDFSYIERKTGESSFKEYLSFSVNEVLSGLQNIELKSNDKIIILSESQIEELIKKHYKIGEYITPNIINFKSKNYILTKSGSIEQLIKSNLITIQGAVSKPGSVLVAGNANLEKVFNLSGGLTNEADTNIISIEIPRLTEEGNISLEEKILDLGNEDIKEIVVVPGSSIRVPKIKSDLSNGFVLIEGEVNQPGVYRLSNDETIFSLLKRSGGLTKNAFIEGLVFRRESEKFREAESVKKLKKELEKSIAYTVSTTIDLAPIDSATISSLRDLALSAESFEPIGRIIGNYKNIDLLKNIKLVNGDNITIPSKPSSVTVVGEVMSPGSILWRKDLDLDGYINNVAGQTQLADMSEIFIIEPNGTARKATGLWLSQTRILPGSTIVVPRKIQLSSTLGRISAITSVIYQLTLSLAGIDSILNR